MRERAWESQSVMTVIGPRNNILRFLATRASRTPFSGSLLLSLWDFYRKVTWVANCYNQSVRD